MKVFKVIAKIVVALHLPVAGGLHTNVGILTENAHKYGFILRYTADKMHITGIVDEPWHWRYVGVEAAKAMKASGQCLEEYLGVA